MKIQPKDKFYPPFDLENTTLRYMIHEKTDGPFGDMYRISITTDSYFRIGEMYIPVGFIKNLPNCVFKSAEYVAANSPEFMEISSSK